MDWSECSYVEGRHCFKFDLDAEDSIAVLSYASQQTAVKSYG